MLLQVEGEAVSLLVSCADMANHSALAPNAAYQYCAAADAFQLRALQVGCFVLGLRLRLRPRLAWLADWAGLDACEGWGGALPRRPAVPFRLPGCKHTDATPGPRTQLQLL